MALLYSCNEDDPPIKLSDCQKAQTTPDSLKYVPIYDRPLNLTEDSIFFAHEQATIKWELPENLIFTEIQAIGLEQPFSCLDYVEFHELGFSVGEFGAGYGNQFVHYLSLGENIVDTVYIPYRIRSVGYEPQGYSEWTDVKSITIIPIQNFTKIRITVDYNFSILTEEIGQEFYSGYVELDGMNLEDIAIDNNLDYEKIVVIRPLGSRVFFKSYFDDGKVPFSKIIAGFDENTSDEAVYPFDVLTEVFPGTYEENPVNGIIYPYGGIYRNLKSEMQQYGIKLAYVLEDIIGKEHELTLELDLEVYLTE